MAKSNYDGYVGLSEKGGVVIGKTSRMDRARGAAQAVDKNYEGSKTAYESYKRKGEADSATTVKQIKQGDEKAIERVQKANTESDNVNKRESNSRPPMSKKWVE